MDNEELRSEPHLDASHYETVLEEREDHNLTLSEKISDFVADFGGSWAFIGLFIVAITIWVIINIITKRPIDPYPFILLNLILSAISVFQAPFIMMSQRRQDDKDRERSAYHLELTRRMACETEAELRQLRRQMTLLPNQLSSYSRVESISIVAENH